MTTLVRIIYSLLPFVHLCSSHNCANTDLNHHPRDVDDETRRFPVFTGNEEIVMHILEAAALKIGISYVAGAKLMNVAII